MGADPIGGPREGQGERRATRNSGLIGTLGAGPPRRSGFEPRAPHPRPRSIGREITMLAFQIIGIGFAMLFLASLLVGSEDPAA